MSGYLTSSTCSLFRGMKVTRPPTFFLFMMDRMRDAVSSVSTTMLKRLQAAYWTGEGERSYAEWAETTC